MSETCKTVISVKSKNLHFSLPFCKTGAIIFYFFHFLQKTSFFESTRVSAGSSLQITKFITLFRKINRTGFTKRFFNHLGLAV